MTVVLELWHLPSTNMIGSWDSAQVARDEIGEGLAGRSSDVLADHALVAEGAAILDSLDNLAATHQTIPVKKAG